MRKFMLLSLLAVGCSGDGTDGTTETPNDPVVNDTPPAPAEISPEELKAKADNIALVPSPAEMDKALERAGIATRLADIVPDRKLKMDVPNQDQVAVRTGVILADLLLTVRNAEPAVRVKHLEDVKTGMNQLGAGTDIAATIDELNGRINNGAVSDDDLVKELDEIAGALIPEIEYEAGERSVPLIEAGSWLSGANLVSQAIIDTGKYEAATDLLRQPAVVEYFQAYVKTEGQDKAPEGVNAQLEVTLDILAEICTHETLSEEDVKAINKSTSDVLALL